MNIILNHVSSVNIPVDLVKPKFVAVVAAIAVSKSSNPSVADVVDFCHWILPTEPVAKFKLVLAPVQIVAEVAVITFATAAGLTVTETTFEVALQAPLVATALYHVVGVAAA